VRGTSEIAHFAIILYIYPRMRLTDKQIQKFQQTIRENYQNVGRHHLPWRKTRNPYRILVSEVMLQQTQVERVIPKYRHFLKSFPTITALSEAPLSEIISMWQGLGYNRRAVMLKKTASIVTSVYNKRIPRSPDILQTLPGIGHATAHSIAAFAFNKPVLFIETNIRTVYIHFFFSRKRRVHDNQILELLEKTLDVSNPREWYYALMDYGVLLKKQRGNLNNRSVHYVKQSRFEGSTRQVRGVIIRLLSQNGKMTKNAIKRSISKRNHDLEGVLNRLQKDGLIRKTGSFYRI
jgi:A/G-specific adenine glycosylase